MALSIPCESVPLTGPSWGVTFLQTPQLLVCWGGFRSPRPGAGVNAAVLGND